MYADNCGDIFHWGNVEISDRGNTKSIIEFLETQHLDQAATNKCINIDPIYQPIRIIMDKYKIKNQIKGRYSHNKKVDNDRLKVKNNQSRLKTTGQAMSHVKKFEHFTST